MHSQFWLEYPKVRDPLIEMDIEGRITNDIKSDLKFIGYDVFLLLIWLRINRNGGLL
jgi:hypothetical protein